MLIGIEAIVKNSHYGMPQEHFSGLLQAASIENVVIGIRPVSKFAKRLILTGHPTKPFVLKAKTSKSGITAGFIPIDPKFSSIGKTNKDEEYKKHGNYIHTALTKDSRLSPMDLVLNEDRILELMQLDQNIKIIKQDQNYLIHWINGAGEFVQARANKNSNGSYNILNEHSNPIQIVGADVSNNGKKIKKGITADYDLMVVAPSYAAWEPGYIDKTPFRTQGSAEKVRTAVIASESDQYHGPREHPTAGNWSPRIARVVKTINEQISEVDKNNPARKETQGLETMHHNAELHNPFADPLHENMPCLLIFPKEINISTDKNNKTRVVLIETPEELIHLRDFLYQEGYYFPTHAKYKDHLKPLSNQKYAEASEATSTAIEKKSSLLSLFKSIAKISFHRQKYETKDKPEEKQPQPKNSPFFFDQSIIIETPTNQARNDKPKRSSREK